MTNPQNPEPLTVTVATALQLSSLGRTKLYELIGRGEIASRTIGARRLIDYASLKRFLCNEGESR